MLKSASLMHSPGAAERIVRLHYSVAGQSPRRTSASAFFFATAFSFRAMLNEYMGTWVEAISSICHLKGIHTKKALLVFVLWRSILP